MSPRPARVPLTLEELQAHLDEQLEFLRSSASGYDRGFTGEAKRLAVTLRILLHEGRTSRSLLGQLGRREDMSLITTAIPHSPRNVGTHGGLVFVAARGEASEYVAMLDQVPFRGWLPLDKWWHQPVFVDDRKAVLARRDLVLTASNQDGGAHVDPTLDETYSRLSKQNSLLWSYVEGADLTPIPNAERAAMRQVSHEVLATLIPGFRQEPQHKADMFFGGAMIVEGPEAPRLTRPPEMARNDPCPCASGKKYKKCHGGPMGQEPGIG